MVFDYFDKYTFLCEMYDENADEIVDLVLNFFPFDNSVQIINSRKGKNLLKRVQLSPLKLEMLQIGNIVNIYSKLLYVKDCAPVTRRTLFSNVQRIIIDYVTNGEVIGLELVAPDAVKKWRQCLGATDPLEAAPGTLRQLYGDNKVQNVAHGCNTQEEALQMLELFFGYDKGIPRIPFRATFKDCTCCVIKPHAVIEGNDMCIHMAEGKCISLEVKCKDPSMNCVCEFRKLCGPRDPDLCRQLYPDSIRAQYGKNIIHNAVHCTDLPEDGELEVEYFFKLMANN
ncbi:nucleoside diphosphate kinase 7-like isoform X3 [Achroia grisella]|uniref:nucleoside diphosphate kinase 7-like isoform X3 n=1 Tax=Achroia grisella TaxID=688607 RepID=UPI0027D2732B|nr:nucleoside diphosphate kinase 7-like isoform X3 [Achroia grisella]